MISIYQTPLPMLNNLNLICGHGKLLMRLSVSGCWAFENFIGNVLVRFHLHFSYNGTSLGKNSVKSDGSPTHFPSTKATSAVFTKKDITNQCGITKTPFKVHSVKSNQIFHIPLLFPNTIQGDILKLPFQISVSRSPTWMVRHFRYTLFILKLR